MSGRVSVGNSECRLDHECARDRESVSERM